MSGTDGISTDLYQAGATGAVTQAAFAIEFDRTTMMKSADIGDLLSDLDNVQATYQPLDGQSSGQANDNKGLDNILNIYQDYLDTNPSDTSLYGSGFDSFAGTDPYLLDLGPDWTDGWYYYYLKENQNDDIIAEEDYSYSTFNCNIYHYYCDKFYYNVPIDTIDAKITIDGPDGSDVKLLLVDAGGNIISNLIETDIFSNGRANATRSFSTSNSVSGGKHFFYLQTAHETDLSQFRISITPVSPTYQVAKYKHISGDSGNTLVYSYKETRNSEVSYVDFRYVEDAQGSLGHTEPVYYKLPYDSTTQKYYLNKMVAMPGLPQETGASHLGESVDMSTYASSEASGQKLVNGQSYWETTGANNQDTYQLINVYNYRNTLFVTGAAHMFSFALRGRVTQNVIIKVEMRYADNFALYLENDQALSGALDADDFYNYRRRTYNVNIGTSPTSFVLKTVSTTNSVWNYLWVSIDDAFTGDVLYYSLVDDVEELMKLPTTSGSGTIDLETLVYGSGFNSTNVANEVMAAQVPQSARLSLNQASETNPTENKVFDITLLLEKITADFGTFSNQIKTSIYALLTWNTGFWKVTKFADIVWNFVNNYGLSSVEKIINWFNDDDRQEALAKIILNDDALKSALNYGGSSGSLDYAAVAKVGLLVFADYIHKTVIETTTWMDNTWTWLFGSSYSLADLVSSALNAGSAALNAVKNAATAVWNGIKAAGKFIANTVLVPIIDGMKDMFILLMKVLGKLISTLEPTLPYSQTADGIVIDGNGIFIVRDNLNLKLTVNDLSVSLRNLFILPSTKIETLSLSGYEIANVQAFLSLAITIAGIFAISFSIQKQESAADLKEQNELGKQVEHPTKNEYMRQTQSKADIAKNNKAINSLSSAATNFKRFAYGIAVTNFIANILLVHKFSKSLTGIDRTKYLQELSFFYFMTMAGSFLSFLEIDPTSSGRKIFAVLLEEIVPASEIADTIIDAANYDLTNPGILMLILIGFGFDLIAAGILSQTGRTSILKDVRIYETAIGILALVEFLYIQWLLKK